MLRFELMKIFKNKLNISAMLLGYLLIVVCIVCYIADQSVYNSAEDVYETGAAAVTYDRKLAQTQTAYVTEQYVTNFLAELQASPLDLDSDDAYMEIVRKNSSMFYFIGNSYTELNQQYPLFNDMKNIDLSDGAQFYKRRIDKIKNFLNMDFSFGNYAAAEKEYWLAKAAQVEEPLVWGSKMTMSMVYDLLAVGFYLLAVIVVCISPVLSRESESGASQLLFTTKYGKTRLIRIKILASLIFSVGYISIGLLSGILVIGLLFGFSEAGLPAQLWNLAIPYDFSIGQICMVEFLVILVISAAVTMLILLLSACTKSTMTTMAAILVLLIGPAFLANSKTCGWYNHLIDLAAIRFVDTKTVLGIFVDYRFGNIIIDYLTMGFVTYFLLAIAAGILVRRVFVDRIMKG